MCAGLTFSSLVRNSHMGIAEPEARATQQLTSKIANRITLLLLLLLLLMLLLMLSMLLDWLSTYCSNFSLYAIYYTMRCMNIMSKKFCRICMQRFLDVFSDVKLTCSIYLWFRNYTRYILSH